MDTVVINKNTRFMLVFPPEYNKEKMDEITKIFGRWLRESDTCVMNMPPDVKIVRYQIED